MSENELSTLSLSNLPVTKFADDEKAVGELTSSSSFLPRIQLFVATSDAVQQGKIPIGHWGLVRGEAINDLGDALNCWPLSWRFKAMRLGDQIIAKHNPQDPEFQKIAAEAKIPNQQGALAGLEFLLYIPDVDSFATYFMANASARKEAPNLRALIGKPTTIESKFTKNAKGKWHAPVVLACQTPLDEPNMEALQPIIAAFINPKDSGIETATKEETEGRAR